MLLMAGVLLRVIMPNRPGSIMWIDDNDKWFTCVSRGRQAIALLLLGFPLSAWTMQPLDDAELAAVSGQDGIAITVTTDRMAAEQVRWELDGGTNYEASLVAGEVSYSSLVNDGQDMANWTTTYDVGSDSTGNPAVSIGMQLDPVRFEVVDLGLQGRDDPAPRYFGSVVMDASGELEYSNTGGLFNNTPGAGAYLYGQLSDLNVFHRQLENDQAPYLILADGSAMWRVHDGSIGVVSGDNSTPLRVGGLRTSADFIDAQLQVTTRYKNPALLGSPQPLRMNSADSIGMYHFGWRGSLHEAELIFGPRGLEYGSDISDGLGFSTRWNYVREDGSSSRFPGTVLANRPATTEGFRWIFGTGDPSSGEDHPMRFELTDWRNMPGKRYAHDFPLIALDIVNPGQGRPQLCWGATSTGPCAGAAPQWVGFQPGRTSVAVSMRDGNMGAYAETVRIYDGADPTQSFNPAEANNRELDWSLIYTFANLDTDIYLSPGGHPDDPDRGLMADILVMAQTLQNDPGGNPQIKGSNWADGAHLMIADTNVGMGIGLMDISFLLLAEDTRILLRPTAAGGGGEYAGGIDITSPRARFDLRATFGGRDLAPKGGADLAPGAARVLTAGVNAWNYEGFLNARLSPPADGENYLGYSLAMRATSASTPSADGQASGQGTYFAMAEPSQLDAELRFGGVSGDMAFVDGKVELISASDDGDNTPKIRMTHDILVGLSAQSRMHDGAWAIGGPEQLPGGAAGQVFRIDSLQLGERNLGSIVVPGGQFYGSLTLKPQTPNM